MEKHNARRKSELQLAKTTPKKKRRIELKKKCVKGGIKRIKWQGNMATINTLVVVVIVMLKKWYVTLVME